MEGETDDHPKCLVKLAGAALLDWQLKAMRGAGVDDIAVVTGYRSDRIDARGVVFFHNPRWAETNMVSTLSRAADWLRNDTCLVSYSDIFYTSAAVATLLKARGDIVVTYDLEWLDLWSRRFADPLCDAETFRVGDDGGIVDIGRRPESVGEVEGQYMGLLKFTPEGWSRVESSLRSLPEKDRDRIDMTSLLKRLIEQGTRVGAAPVSGGWGEVDTKQDLDLYERMMEKGEIKGFSP